MTTLVHATDVETALTEVLAGVVRSGDVAVDDHFFDDLGADSMVMTQFCARVRKRDDLPSVSIKDVYAHPTIAGLAAALEETGAPATDEPPAELAKPASTPQYVLTGVLQVVFVLAYFYVAALVATAGYEWIAAGQGLIGVYARAVVFGAGGFAVLCLLPIALKWVLVGRWKGGQQIRIWSLGYVRFWIVKTLVRSNPLVLFAGSPLYVLYLRALGARIGKGAAIFSQHVPVCTDLLTVGDGTVIRKDSYFTCYRAESGVIRTGAVTLGSDVLVGEATALDIDTSLGDGAQLGHSSALHAGQAVPAGEHRIGSPAEHLTGHDYRAVESRRCGSAARAAYAGLQLLAMVVVLVPLSIGGLAALIAAIPPLGALVDAEAITSAALYRDALAASFVLFFGWTLAGLIVVATVPRALNRLIAPDKVYRLYGLHYLAHRTIARISNAKFFIYLFGDSSAIVHYLRWIGYDLSTVEQTGSNFGLETKHESPFLSSVGRGSMVADQSSMINADFSSTSFRATRTAIGSHNFLGNYVAYPSQGRTGDDCLLATKVMVPVEGPVRQGVGLLGSPSFEIPRSVYRDTRFDHFKTARRLAAKNRHNAGTIAMFLAVRWIHVFGVLALAGAALQLYPSVGAVAFAASAVLALAWGVLFFVLVERAVARFRPLRPRYCSIYEPYFWWHERYWKLSTQPKVLDGTPFKSLAWRLMGVRIGKRVFDDGAAINEKTMVAIGDDCALNLGSVIQPHSQEDGAFKSDRIAIGAGCTVGVGALVHYGVKLGDGAVLAPDSFLMKGEDVPPHARWGGNPARDLR